MLRKNKSRSLQTMTSFFFFFLIDCFCYSIFWELCWNTFLHPNLDCTSWCLLVCSIQVCVLGSPMCVRWSSILAVTVSESSQQNCLAMWQLCSSNLSSVACWHIGWDCKYWFQPCNIRLDVRFDLNLSDTPVENGAAWNCWAMKWGCISCCAVQFIFDTATLMCMTTCHFNGR